MELVSLQHVNAGYDGNIVLSDVNFTIHSRDFTGIVGPNGGGKTTLIKVILKLLTPYSGTVSYSSEIEYNRLRRIGYLPQNNHIDKAFPISVTDVILSGLQSGKGLFGRYTKADKLKMEKLLDMASIAYLKDEILGDLSGGQMQRVLLCRALISEPPLLILDEPNTYVDTKFEKELYDLLKTINETVAILLVTHDISMVSHYVKSIACVNRDFHMHPSNTIIQIPNNYKCQIGIFTNNKNITH